MTKNVNEETARMLAAKHAREQALRHALPEGKRYEPADYWQARAQAQKEAGHTTPVPLGQDRMQQMGQAFRDSAQQQRQDFKTHQERRQREDPYRWDGRGMRRPLSQEEKQRLINPEQ